MSEPAPPTPRDFDAWALLANSDPETFETRRREVIQKAISRAPARQQRRLQQLQWQLDQIRACSPTPSTTAMLLLTVTVAAISRSSGEVNRRTSPMGSVSR